jgi:hypothetical protein
MQLWATSDSGSISFVSYFSFVSKRLEPQRSIATWSHSYIMAQKRLFFYCRAMDRSAAGLAMALRREERAVVSRELPLRSYGSQRASLEHSGMPYSVGNWPEFNRVPFTEIPGTLAA